MKLARVLVASCISLGVATAGCGDEKHTVSECAGNYSGDYTGTISGTLSGTLDTDQIFMVSFVQGGLGIAISGTSMVADDGAIMFDIGGNTIDGRMNLTNCTAKGNWTYGGLASGTWMMARH